MNFSIEELYKDVKLVLPVEHVWGSKTGICTEGDDGTSFHLSRLYCKGHEHVQFVVAGMNAQAMMDQAEVFFKNSRVLGRKSQEIEEGGAPLLDVTWDLGVAKELPFISWLDVYRQEAVKLCNDFELPLEDQITFQLLLAEYLEKLGGDISKFKRPRRKPTSKVHAHNWLTDSVEEFILRCKPLPVPEPHFVWTQSLMPL